MANLSSIARPYALAAFEIARDKQQLPAWKAFLESASHVARDPRVNKLIANPEFSSSSLIELFTGVLASQITPDHKNFLLLLSQNQRLDVLPAISEAFNAYYSALEKISMVRVITALEIKDDYRERLVAALTKRIKNEVKLKCEIDPEIMGGAIIQIGDRVIDGSVRGKLARLLEFSLR